MTIADSLQQAIVGRGIIVPGRAQWITMQVQGGLVGFLNIYAPNVASARAEFWSQIVESLPQAEHWCIGGDFNMLEDPSDRIGGSHATVHGVELAAWERFCMTLGLGYMAAFWLCEASRESCLL
ncbi:hypothetical protein DD606_25175 [Enterobacter cloacae complex sp. GF14B]|nr:hypothetical protein DD606_25175 [Enterobacter cloacae complex sp. GF14B]